MRIDREASTSALARDRICKPPPRRLQVIAIAIEALPAVAVDEGTSVRPSAPGLGFPVISSAARSQQHPSSIMRIEANRSFCAGENLAFWNVCLVSTAPPLPTTTHWCRLGLCVFPKPRRPGTRPALYITWLVLWLKSHEKRPPGLMTLVCHIHRRSFCCEIGSCSSPRLTERVATIYGGTLRCTRCRGRSRTCPAALCWPGESSSPAIHDAALESDHYCRDSVRAHQAMLDMSVMRRGGDPLFREDHLHMARLEYELSTSYQPGEAEERPPANPPPLACAAPRNVRPPAVSSSSVAKSQRLRPIGPSEPNRRRQLRPVETASETRSECLLATDRSCGLRHR